MPPLTLLVLSRLEELIGQIPEQTDALYFDLKPVHPPHQIMVQPCEYFDLKPVHPPHQIMVQPPVEKRAKIGGSN